MCDSYRIEQYFICGQCEVHKIRNNFFVVVSYCRLEFRQFYIFYLKVYRWLSANFYQDQVCHKKYVYQSYRPMYVSLFKKKS